MDVFVRICVEEVQNSNMNGGCLSSIGYENLAKKFYEATGLTYTKLQFKNKWDKMKEWTMWASTGNAIGDGWDNSRGTRAQTDEWWEDWILIIVNLVITD